MIWQKSVQIWSDRLFLSFIKKSLKIYECLYFTGLITRAVNAIDQMLRKPRVQIIKVRLNSIRHELKQIEHARKYVGSTSIVGLWKQLGYENMAQLTTNPPLGAVAPFKGNYFFLFFIFSPPPLHHCSFPPHAHAHSHLHTENHKGNTHTHSSSLSLSLCLTHTHSHLGSITGFLLCLAYSR